MRTAIRSFVLVMFAATLLQTYAQTPSAKVPVTTLVTVLGPKFTAPPPITKQDLIVTSGKTRLDVINWEPAQGQRGGLQLAIVIDNSASQLGVGSQLNELASFITAQAKPTAVGVFYAANGTVQTAAPFSTDHEAVAKTLRVPLGLRAGESPSVYLSLSDLVKNKWHMRAGRREVLLISSGIDRMDRGPESPYVQEAIEDVEKAGVVVHAIDTGGVRLGDSIRGEFAEGNLAQLTAGSGGYNLFDGITAPVSFSPYLKELDMALRNQYRLTFAIEPSNKSKGEIRDIKIRTEQHNVDLRYAKQVLVPGVTK